MNADDDFANRPLFNLIRQLPRCTVFSSGEVDYEGSDPALILRLGKNAAQVMATVHRGTTAIGLLIANAGSEIEDRSLSADVVEAHQVLRTRTTRSRSWRISAP